MRLLAASGIDELGSISPAARTYAVVYPPAHKTAHSNHYNNVRSHSRPLVIAVVLSVLVHVAILTLSYTQPHTSAIYAGTPLTVSIQPSSATVAGSTTTAPQPPTTADREDRPAPVQDRPLPTQAQATPAPQIDTPRTSPVIGKRSEMLNAAKQNSVVQPTTHSNTSMQKGMQPVTHPVTQPATQTQVKNGDNPHDSIAQKLQTSLGIQFAHAFHYPRLAQRKGWQGKVTLGLRVEPDGQLSDIHLVQTSGYALLDNDALNTLRRVAQLPEASQWLQERHLNMVLPVEYRLIDG